MGREITLSSSDQSSAGGSEMVGCTWEGGGQEGRHVVGGEEVGVSW